MRQRFAVVTEKRTPLLVLKLLQRTLKSKNPTQQIVRGSRIFFPVFCKIFEG